MPSIEEKQKKTFGLIAVGAFGSVAVSLLVGSLPFVLPAFRQICLPYVPATDSQIQNVVKLLKARKGNLIDLGSGDGRI
ncbi:ATP synthase subunit C lysine N-methyltransferase, partial [Nephila pilipes]